MPESYAGLAVLALVWLGAMAQQGSDWNELYNRQRFGFLLIGLAIGAWLTTIQFWAGLLCVWTVLGTTLVPGSTAWRGATYRSLLVAVGYGVLVSSVTADWIVPVLSMMVVIGTLTAAWVLVGEALKDDTGRDGRFHWPIPYTRWAVYDPEKGNRIRGGQGNPNHYDGVIGFSIAACGGLLFLGAWWPLPCAGLMLVASLLHKRITQGHLFYAVTAVGLVALHLPCDWPWLWLGGVVGAGLLIFRPWRWTGAHSPSSGRVEVWRCMLVYWWQQGWPKRLLGFGTSSWLSYSLQFKQESKKAELNAIYTNAHNEYVQQTIEGGLIGLGLMGAFLGSLFWQTWHGGPEGRAVWLVLLTGLTMALTNFPWTWLQAFPNLYEQRVHRVPKDRLTMGMALTAESTGCPIRPGVPLRYQIEPATGDLIVEEVGDTEPLYVGSPTLVWWSLAVAVCAGVV